MKRKLLWFFLFAAFVGLFGKDGKAQNPPSPGGVSNGHAVTKVLTCPTSSNSGTAEVCNTSPTFTPAAGDSIIFQADIANTGAFTLNVNSLGAKAVKKNGTTALVANDILASPFQVILTYDGTNWEMQGQAGNAAAAGNSGCNTSPNAPNAGLVCLEAHTASSSAELDFTSCISSTYDEYQLEFINIFPSSSGASIGFQVSTNGGSSYYTTATYTSSSLIHSTSSGTVTITNSTTVASGALVAALHTNAAWGASGTFKIQGTLSSSLVFRVYGQVFFENASDQQSDAIVYSTVGSVQNTNAFRILASTGNIASGTVRCYGISH